MLKSDLHNELVRAARVRSIVSMSSMLPSMLFGGLLLESLKLPPNDLLVGIISISTAFGIPMTVSMLITRFYCRKIVICPQCNQSLWDCGTNSFKPRRIKIKEAITECPHCKLPIV